MVFDIAKLDKMQLIQTLYLHADPKGMGHRAYHAARKAGKRVEGWLPLQDCESIIRGDHETPGYMVDYFNGKPLKQYWQELPTGQLTADTLPYDSAHGKYRFLEALLNMFDPEEICILEKDYDPVQEKIFFKPEKIAFRQQEDALKNILEEAKLNSTTNGLCWLIDPSGSTYQSTFRHGLDL